MEFIKTNIKDLKIGDIVKGHCIKLDPELELDYKNYKNFMDRKGFRFSKKFSDLEKCLNFFKDYDDKNNKCGKLFMVYDIVPKIKIDYGDMNCYNEYLFTEVDEKLNVIEGGLKDNESTNPDFGCVRINMLTADGYYLKELDENYQVLKKNV